MPSHCKTTHVSKGSHRSHSAQQIRFHGTEVPQGDQNSVVEGKSVMTLMRPKKNAVRSSQILLIHSKVLIFRLISSVKQSSRSFSKNVLCSKHTVYCEENNRMLYPLVRPGKKDLVFFFVKPQCVTYWHEMEEKVHIYGFR